MTSSEIIEKVLNERETYDDGFMSVRNLTDMIEKALSLQKEETQKVLSSLKGKIEEEIKEKSSFRVVNGKAGKQRITDFIEGEDVGRKSERELCLKIVNSIFDDALKEMGK